MLLSRSHQAMLRCLPSGGGASISFSRQNKRRKSDKALVFFLSFARLEVCVGFRKSPLTAASQKPLHTNFPFRPERLQMDRSVALFPFAERVVVSFFPPSVWLRRNHAPLWLHLVMSRLLLGTIEERSLYRHRGPHDT